MLNLNSVIWEGYHPTPTPGVCFEEVRSNLSVEETGGLGKTAAGPSYAAHHAGCVTFSRKTENTCMHPLGRISGTEKPKPCFHSPQQIGACFSPTTRSPDRGQLLGLETA